MTIPPASHVNFSSSYEVPKILKITHWLVAFLVITMLLIGWSFSEIPSGPFKNTLRDFHKSTGYVILVLMVARLVIRHYFPLPPLPSTTPKFTRILARVGQALIHTAVIAMAMNGILMSQFAGRPGKIYGLVSVPQIATINGEHAMWFRSYHGTIASVLAILIALHLCGSLYHHFILKDDVLRRMTRWRPPSGGTTGGKKSSLKNAKPVQGG